MKRPLWVTGLSFCVGLLLANLLGFNASVWMAAACLALCGGSLLFPSLRSRREIAGALLAALAGFGAFAVKESLIVRPLAAFDGTVQTIEARVLEGNADFCVVSALDSTLPEGTRVKVWLGTAEWYPDVDDVIRAEIQLAVPSQNQLSLKADGIYLTGFCTGYADEAMEIIPSAYRSVQGALGDLRDAFVQSVRRLLPQEEGDLVAAICLGDEDGLSYETTEAFRRTGLTHLLVVSGLHMSIISQAVLSLLKMLRVPRRLAAGVAGAVVLFFMLLTGMTPSVVRAGVMCLVLLCGQIISREADSLNSMGFALLLLAVPNPYSILDVGLQLSFAATFGLVVLAPCLWRGIQAKWRARHARRTTQTEEDEEWEPPRLLAGPLHALCVTLSATLPTLPLLALYFHELSVVSPLSNLLGVFPTSVLLVTGCLAMGLSAVPFMSWAVRGLLVAAGLIAKYLLGLTGIIGSWGAATVSLAEPYLLVWLIGAMLLGLLGYRLLGVKGLRRSLALSVLALACGLGVHTALTRGVTTVTALDAGDNMAVLIERDGHAGLAVAGESGNLLENAWYALRRRGIRRLDFLLLPDLDGMKIAWLRDFTDRMPVEALLYPQGSESGPFAQTATAGAQEAYGPKDVFTFWNTGRIAFEQGGWVRMELGQTRLLLCPANGDAAALPADWRQTHLAVFAGTPPAHLTAISAQGGLFGCAAESLPYVVKAMPWGMYPIKLTATEGEVQAVTRGKGDLGITSRYF